MKRVCNDIKRYWNYVVYAGITELRTEIADSYLNWLWWIIEPLCFMLIYSFVFVTLFNNKMDHANIFVYTGITIWEFFNRMMGQSVKCVRTYKAIVSKVYIPKFILLLVKTVVNGIKMLICLGLLLVMLVVVGIPFTLQMLWMIPILLTLFILSFGLGTFLLHFGVYVDDLQNVTTIVLRMMMYVTGVFYNLEEKLGTVMSASKARLIGNVNPIACIVNSARSVLLYGEAPNIKFLSFWFVAGVVLSMIGISLIYHNENNYVKVI